MKSGGRRYPAPSRSFSTEGGGSLQGDQGSLLNSRSNRSTSINLGQGIIRNYLIHVANENSLDWLEYRKNPKVGLQTDANGCNSFSIFFGDDCAKAIRIFRNLINLNF
jgi:hypothetical protein